MKTLYKILLFTILFYNFSYSQVSTSIIDVFVNSQATVASCNTIDFSGNTNNSLDFFYRLQKSSAGYCPDGNLKIMLKYSSSTYGSQRGSTIFFTSTSWDSNNRAEGYISCNISASEVQVSGSSIYLEYTDCSGNLTQSCEYPIIKTPPPTFTLSPTTLSIPCGSVAPVTFSYSNVYSTPGVTYNYSYSGWTFVSQTPNSITLKPANANILPSNFSLVPIVNGVTQPYKVCTVTRAPFTTTSAITGSGVVCPGATTTFNLTDSSSFSNVTWSIPEFDVATILSSTNSSVTIQAMASGTFTINAVVENACAQTKTSTRSFNIGVPYVNPNYNSIYGVFDWYSTNYISPTTASVHYVQNATSYVWSITGSPISSSCTNRPKFSNGSTTTMTTTSNQVNINWGGCTGNFVLWCKPKNSCGISNAILAQPVTIGNAADNPCDNSPIGLKMKNPIKVSDEIVLNIHHSQLPCDTSNNLKIAKQLTKEEVENIEYTIDIYDFYGRKLLSRKEKSSQIKISDTNLSKGKYIINISNDLGNIKREILLVE